jgi:hypothetical protein
LITLQTGNNVSIIPDTYRQEQMQWFLQRPQQFNYKRMVQE